MIVLTQEAADAVKSAMAKTGKEDAGLRIMVEAGGCAGYKYLIGLDPAPRAGRRGDRDLRRQGVHRPDHTAAGRWP